MDPVTALVVGLLALLGAGVAVLARLARRSRPPSPDDPTHEAAAGEERKRLAQLQRERARRRDELNAVDGETDPDVRSTTISTMADDL